MIFNSKQLEELEQVHDASGVLEDADEETPEQGRDAAMEWRLQSIEEAAENVKRAKARPVDEGMTYEINSLLFDRDSRRFARVQASVPGYLRIGYLTGGDREYGVLDVDLFLIDVGSQKRPTELASQLGITEVEVLVHLARLDITPLEPDADEDEDAAADGAEATLGTSAATLAAALAAPPAGSDDGAHAAENGAAARALTSGKRAAKGAKGSSAKPKGASTSGQATAKDAQPPPGAKTPSKGKPPSAKAAPAKAAPAKATAAKATAAKAAPTKATAAKAAPTKVTAAKATAAKATAAKTTGKGGKKDAEDPLGDPNGYIRQNFQQMSNREMARATGLSEHTIRRKLGEWGLKRGAAPTAPSAKKKR